MNQISEKLKYLRYLKRLTQKEVANSIGVTTSAYGFYEQGKRIPPIDVIVKLAEYFDVTTDFLLGSSKGKDPMAYLNEEPSEEMKKYMVDLDYAVYFDRIKALNHENFVTAFKLIDSLLFKQEREEEDK